MNYSDALRYLKKIQELGAKLELDSIQKIIHLLPFSLKGIKFIQVAGTNGKGSTAHFITSILKSGGYRVGLFTSPHLQDIRERISINKEWITQKDFARAMTHIVEITEGIHRDGEIDTLPTFFEHLLLVSLSYFHKKKVDFAVLEVGLGGRLDATSAIKPELTVITNISKDHTKTLGKRIRDIAAEKAGCIKPSVPVVCGCNVRSVANGVIKKRAMELKAPFYNVVNPQNTLTVEYAEDHYRCHYHSDRENYLYTVYMNGQHQTRNAATAIRAIETLKTQGVSISKNAIYEGIKSNFVPGRIEMIKGTPKIILDGGHNEESIKSLHQFLSHRKINGLTLVFGVLRDKNYRKMIRMLSPFIKNVILTEPVSKRLLPAEKLVKNFEGKRVSIEKDPEKALKKARQLKRDILITGSLYLAGYLRNIIIGGYSHG